MFKLTSFSSIPEQDDDNLSLQDKEKDVRFSQENLDKGNVHDEPDEEELQSPQLQEDDENKEAKDVHDISQIAE